MPSCCLVNSPTQGQDVDILTGHVKRKERVSRCDSFPVDTQVPTLHHRLTNPTCHFNEEKRELVNNFKRLNEAPSRFMASNDIKMLKESEMNENLGSFSSTGGKGNQSKPKTQKGLNDALGCRCK